MLNSYEYLSGDWRQSPYPYYKFREGGCPQPPQSYHFRLNPDSYLLTPNFQLLF